MGPPESLPCSHPFEPSTATTSLPLQLCTDRQYYYTLLLLLLLVTTSTSSSTINTGTTRRSVWRLVCLQGDVIDTTSDRQTDRQTDGAVERRTGAVDGRVSAQRRSTAVTARRGAHLHEHVTTFSLHAHNTQHTAQTETVD